MQIIDTPLVVACYLLFVCLSGLLVSATPNKPGRAILNGLLTLFLSGFVLASVFPNLHAPAAFAEWIAFAVLLAPCATFKLAPMPASYNPPTSTLVKAIMEKE